METVSLVTIASSGAGFMGGTVIFLLVARLPPNWGE